MQPMRFCTFIMGILMCCMHSNVNAASTQNDKASDFETEYEQSFIEVPVDSIQQFVQIYGIVKDNYVDAKPDDILFNQAIRGLVSGLDRYSRYLSQEDYKQLLQYTEGDLATVDFSLIFEPSTQQWEIRDLKPDSDSYKLGFRNGQGISKIDDQNIQNLNHDQIVALLYGTIGSTVQVQHASTNMLQTLVRNKKIETNIQPILLHNQVLVLKVRVFQQDTANEIKRFLEQYDTSKLKALIIDLRNNPGGLLSAAVETADLFLNHGVIVSTKSRSEGSQQFQALPSNEFQNLKLGVLINQRSASAAEVFTAAMKEHKRAWVVGERSYGKGVVQKIFPLPDGAALQMTVSHYYTPNGSMIEGKGIQPNMLYALPMDMRDEVYLTHIAELLLQQR